MESVSKRIISFLKTIRATSFHDEYAIQDLIESGLKSLGMTVVREYKLGRGRVDFFVEGVIVEVKSGKPNSKLLRKQIERYASFDVVREVIVVVERNVFSLPNVVNDKPVSYVSLSANWGLSL